MAFVINSQVVLSRPPEGPLADYIGSFADSLSAMGYATSSIHRQAHIGASFSQWLGRKEVVAENITQGHLTRYLRQRWRRCRPCRGDHAALTHLIDFLRCASVIAPEKVAVDERSAVDRCIGAYEAYLREERGLVTATVINYVPFVRDFLRHRFGGRPVDLSCLAATDVLRFVRRQAARLSRKRAKLMTTALRSFLQYVRYRGEIDVDLSAAVPVVPK